MKCFLISFVFIFAGFVARSQQFSSAKNPKDVVLKQRLIWLDELPIKSFSEGIPGILTKTNQGGDSMRMAGTTYTHGIGVASTSIISFLLEGKATEFSATVGVDDLGNKMLPHFFYVLGDGKILFASGAMKLGDQPKSFTLDLKGVQRLGMLVMVKDEGHTKVYSNWADAKIMMLGDAKPGPIPNQAEKYILTPAPSKKPKINTAPVFGVRPGNPFLFTIVASGEKPMQFSADRLPKGLTLDTQTGIITGKLMEKGNHEVVLKAENQVGTSQKLLVIKVGDTISLTPPMGWNGWNSWARLIDGEKVIASANAMVNMGLKDHGWNYVNIDDAWQGKRGGKYNALQANEKFPDFKKMIDQIHAMGLKLGVYSTPWITSYAGYPGGSSIIENGDFPDSVKNNKRAFRYTGKFRFEKEDALQMADWGVDFLKYDWRLEVPSAERMSIALKNSGRDIIYSLSNSAPFSDVKDWARISNMYRTGPDIRDSWHGLYHCTFTLDKWGPYGGPGHWNDPDMMILGNVTTGSEMHPTRLTPDEQYTHISLFALLSAPLLIGCPIEQLDAFTLNLLTNDEVIEIDQDPLGKSARLMADEGGIQTWLKPMADGSYAVGFFNTADYGKTPASFFRWGTEKPKQFNVDFTKLGLNGSWRVQDVWRQKNLGVKASSFSTIIPHHGVMMYRLFPVNIPAVSNPDKRVESLKERWNALHQSPPKLAVRDCFIFLLDALENRFLKPDEILWTIDLVKTRIIADSTKPSFGNMYWGWTETGGDVGDGNNVEFCVQYGILIKLLFNDRLSPEARASLDDLFAQTLNGIRRQPVRISYTNIYVMRCWNLLALGQVYNNPIATAEGTKAFDSWLKHVANYGNREYDSPTYCGVDLESLLLMYRFIQDKSLKAKAADALEFFLTDLSAHYNKDGGYLEGAHSRDYNRVFGRDLLEEKYMDPLLGKPNNNNNLFHQVCFSILKELNLSKAHQKVMEQKDKFIIQRWDSLPHTYAYDYHGKKFSIASSNQYYSPDDKSFIAYLSSKKIPAMPNIVYVAEGRNDHYGTWGSEGMGEKLKHLMPPNYPANGGWGKTRHLMPFMQTVQNKNEFVMLVSGMKDHNCINPYINSTVILPNYFDQIWLGNKQLGTLKKGDAIAFDETNTFFGKFEDVGVAIRILWSNASSKEQPQLINDGFIYEPRRENFSLPNNKAIRFTLKHPNDGLVNISMWWKIEEGLTDDAKFNAFRQSVLNTKVEVSDQKGIVDVAVFTPNGKLGLKADLNQKQRLDYYSPYTLPKDFLFNINGVEVGRKIMEKYRN